MIMNHGYGFVNRKPSQYKHDKVIDMSDATEPWFAALVTRHQETIKSDDLYLWHL